MLLDELQSLHVAETARTLPHGALQEHSADYRVSKASESPAMERSRRLHLWSNSDTKAFLKMSDAATANWASQNSW